jgi:hypothetical protein
MTVQRTEGAIARDTEAVATAIEALASEGRLTEEMPIELTRRLLAAATRAYVAHREAGERSAPFASTPGVKPITATEAVVTASEMLKALDLEVFELAMWQSQGNL